MTREVTVQSHAAPVANLLAIALGAASRSVRSLRPRLRSALRGSRYGSLPITGADGAQDHQQGSAGTYGGGAMQSNGWLKTESCKILSVLPQRGPLGPFGVSGDQS